jgi:photosystem II stability/assembly factor-like uncharacterized protein
MVTMHNPVKRVSPVQPVKRAIWIRWVLAHVLILSTTLSLLWWAYATTYYGLGALFVLPFAIIAPFLAQWVGIRRLLQPKREFWFWLIASVIGFALVALILVVVLVVFRVTNVPLPASLAIFGGVLGLAQSCVLQRHVSRAFWWIPANALGLAAGFFIATLVAAAIRPLCQSTATLSSGVTPFSINYCDFLPLVLFLVVGTALFSIITGTTLVWLVSHTGEVRPAISGRQLALGTGILCLGGVLFAVVILLQFQADTHRNSTILYDVSMVSPEEGWVIGDENEGAAIFQYSGGKWTETSLPQPLRVDTLRSISMVSASEGWSVGDGSTFLHYSNGTWSKADTPAGINPDLYVRSVDMLSPSEGWAIGADAHGGASTLLHYTGGKWASVHNPTSEIMSSLNFGSAEDGWAVGSNGTILHYSNGAWQQYTSPMLSELRSVDMVSQNEGWVVGSGGRQNIILHYAGSKWSKVESPTDPNLTITSISMVSTHEGWAVGNTEDYSSGVTSGVILHYNGDTWAREEMPGIPSFRALYSVSMVSSDEGWAVGQGFTLLHYKAGRWTKYP